MTLPSPCVRNCCLDENDVCIGCGRTVEEIIHWGDADNNERLQILETAKIRKLKKTLKVKIKVCRLEKEKREEEKVEGDKSSNKKGN